MHFEVQLDGRTVPFRHRSAYEGIDGFQLLLAALAHRFDLAPSQLAGATLHLPDRPTIRNGRSWRAIALPALRASEPVLFTLRAGPRRVLASPPPASPTSLPPSLSPPGPPPNYSAMTDNPAPPAPFPSNPTSPATSVASSSSSWPTSEPAALETPVSPTWSRSRVEASDLEAEDEGGVSPVVGSRGEREGEGAVSGTEEDSEVVSKEEQKGEDESAAKSVAIEEETKSVELASVKSMGGKAEDESAVKEERVGVVDTPASPPPFGVIEVEHAPAVSAPSKPAFVLTRPTLAGENETVSLTQPSTPATPTRNGEEDDSAAAKTANERFEPEPEKEATKEEKGKEPARTSPAISLNTTGAFLHETHTAGSFFASPAPLTAVSPSSKTAAFFGTDFQAQVPPPSPTRPAGAYITELSDAEITLKKVPTPAKEDEEDARPHQKEVKSSSRSTVSTRPLVSPLKPDEHDSTKQEHRHRHAHDSRSHSRERRRRQQQQAVRDVSTSDSDDDLPIRLPFVHSRTIVSAVVRPLRREPTQPQPQSHRSYRPAPPPPSPPSPPTPPRPSRLELLLRDVKTALDVEPAAYYALKGVLAEFEEKNAQAREQQHRGPPPPSRRDPPRFGRFDPPRREEKERRERRDRPVPVPRYSLTQTTDEDSDSLTEVELIRPARHWSQQGRLVAIAPSFSPHPPPRRVHGRPAPPPPAREPISQVLRPVALRPCHPPSAAPNPHLRPLHSDAYAAPSCRQNGERDRVLSPPRGQTLTVAQAAALAEGLGDETELERLRASGLRGREKVSKLGEGKKAKGGKEKMPKPAERLDRHRYRHSLNSVFDARAPPPVKKVSFPPSSSAVFAHLSPSFLHPFQSSVPVSPPRSSAAVKLIKPTLHTAVGPRRDSGGKDDVYPSPTVKASHEPAFYFGGKGKFALKEKKADERARKRARQGTFPSYGGARQDSMSCDFDDFP
ncbi:hypothetical protein JCM8097_009175 [Rhodosporidiobolus ruineniae]